MKRLSVIMILALLFSAGCCKTEENVPKIEDYEWRMFSVQSMEDGQGLAYGECGGSTSETAKQIELTCAAKNGNLTITDKTNTKTYSGTYSLAEKSSQASIYEIVIEGMEGMAVVSMTTYQNGKEEPTFIISLEDYAVNFYAK